MDKLLPGLAFSLAVAFGMPVQAHTGHGAHSASAPENATPMQGIVISGCWVRALPHPLPGAGYLVLRNTGAHDAVLVGARSSSFGKTMLHTHKSVDGMSAMVHVDSVTVPAGGTFEFAPGGHHVMLEQPVGEVAIGSQVPITLLFEGNRALSVDCEARPAGTMGR